MATARKPVATNLMNTGPLMALKRELEVEGCEVTHDTDAGTLKATDDGVVVLKALQKGYNQPWIVLFFETDRIQWTKPEDARGTYTQEHPQV